MVQVLSSRFRRYGILSDVQFRSIGGLRRSRRFLTLSYMGSYMGIHLWQPCTRDAEYWGEHGVPDMGEHGVPEMGEHGVPEIGEHGVPGMDEHGEPEIPEMGEHGVLRWVTEYLGWVSTEYLDGDGVPRMGEHGVLGW